MKLIAFDDNNKHSWSCPCMESIAYAKRDTREVCETCILIILRKSYSTSPTL